MPARCALLVAVVTAVLAASCSTASTVTPAHPTTSAPATGSTGPGRPGTTIGTPVASLVLTESDNGRSVSITVGGHVTLVLASTYWTVAPVPDGAVLRADGVPVTEPHLGHCVVGQGCGTVTAHWVAVAPGKATVTAGRTVCGEALACGADRRSFRVTVTVT